MMRDRQHKWLIPYVSGMNHASNVTRHSRWCCVGKHLAPEIVRMARDCLTRHSMVKIHQQNETPQSQTPKSSLQLIRVRMQ